MSAPIYLILSADAGVAALVVDRIFPAGIIPQEITTLPAIVYQTVTGTAENVLTDRAPVDMERIQIDCWSTTDAGASAVANAVRAAFENIPAMLANGCAALLTGFNGHDYDKETKHYRESTDWSFWTLR